MEHFQPEDLEAILAEVKQRVCTIKKEKEVEQRPGLSDIECAVLSTLTWPLDATKLDADIAYVVIGSLKRATTATCKLGLIRALTDIAIKCVPAPWHRLDTEWYEAVANMLVDSPQCYLATIGLIKELTKVTQPPHMINTAIYARLTHIVTLKIPRQIKLEAVKAISLMLQSTPESSIFFQHDVHDVLFARFMKAFADNIDKALHTGSDNITPYTPLEEVVIEQTALCHEWFNLLTTLIQSPQGFDAIVARRDSSDALKVMFPHLSVSCAEIIINAFIHAVEDGRYNAIDLLSLLELIVKCDRLCEDRRFRTILEPFIAMIQRAVQERSNNGHNPAYTRFWEAYRVYLTKYGPRQSHEYGHAQLPAQ